MRHQWFADSLNLNRAIRNFLHKSLQLSLQHSHLALHRLDFAADCLLVQLIFLALVHLLIRIECYIKRAVLLDVVELELVVGEVFKLCGL